MMPFFNRIGLERVGVVGLVSRLLRTGLKPLDPRAGDRTAAWRVYRFWIVGPDIGLMVGWSEGSGCGSSLQKEQERRRVGGGFARSRSDD